MTPEVRAAADRLILDTANVKYLAAIVPKEALDANIPGREETVRQLLAHIATRLEDDAANTEAFLQDQPLPSHPDEEHLGGGQGLAEQLPNILGRIGLAVARMLNLFESIPEAALERPIDGRLFIEALRDWTSHCGEHAIDLVSAVPEIRLDPMILNWVLYIDYSGDPMREARQQDLLAYVREHLPDTDEDDWEDGDDWEEGGEP